MQYTVVQGLLLVQQSMNTRQQITATAQHGIVMHPYNHSTARHHDAFMQPQHYAHLCKHPLLCSSESEAQGLSASLHHPQLLDPGPLQVHGAAGGPPNLPSQQQLQLEQQQLLKSQAALGSFQVSCISGLMDCPQSLHSEKSVSSSIKS